jgi:hypothetical protein
MNSGDRRQLCWSNECEITWVKEKQHPLSKIIIQIYFREFTITNCIYCKKKVVLYHHWSHRKSLDLLPDH